MTKTSLRYFLYSGDDGHIEVVDTYADCIVFRSADKSRARAECTRLNKKKVT